MDSPESPSSCSLTAHDGLPMACDCAGAGEPLLLFIHGWTCRRTYWSPQIKYFRAHYRLAAIDLPGHGDTPPGERRHRSVDTLARDVAAAAEGLAAERVVLIGHSMGGRWPWRPRV